MRRETPCRAIPCGARAAEMTGLAVPKDLRDITPSWLTGALRSSGDLSGASVTGFSAEAIAEGKGFMSHLFRLRLDYDSDVPDLPSTVIVKLPTTDPLLRTVFDGLGQNRREVRFYEEALIGGHLKTPRCCYGVIDPATGNSVLLLEDMSDARQGDSVAGCSMAETQHCIGQLARFQASWWDSPSLDRLDWMPSRDQEARAYQEIYTGAWESFVEKAGDGMPRRLRLLGDRLGREVPKIKAGLAKPPRTIAHGDYRLDNFFFLTDGESQPPVVFDWEFCVRGRGVYDVATFISDTLPPQQRRDEELGLLHVYHATLVDNGVSGYPFEECLSDYRLSMLEVFVFWIVSGGYCDYDGERASLYLRNMLERFDAAIADLASTELL